MCQTISPGLLDKALRLHWDLTGLKGVGPRVKMSVCCAWQVEWDDLARFVYMNRLFWSFGEKGMIVLEFSLSKQLCLQWPLGDIDTKGEI